MTRTMKDSGIDWIGEIPEDWHVDKMNRICSVITDYVASGSFGDLAENVQYLDEPDYAMLIRTIDISCKGHESKPVYINKHAYEYLHNSNLFGGEIILPNIGASVGDVYIVPNLYDKMSLAPNSIMIKPTINNKFVYYYFSSSAGRLSLYNIAQSTAQPKFNKTDFRQIKMPLPHMSEQEKIADFLDEKCSHIDAVLEKTRASIEEYKQLKQSVITKAVTKGIRPNRPMKDSGIEWIGEIPEDWEIRKFKYVLSNTLQYGANESGVPYDSALPRYIRITDITQDGKLKETDKLSLPKDVAQPFILKDGDILFARSGGTVGKSFIYKAEYEESCFAGYLIRATIKETVLPKLVYYWTCSSIYEEWKNSIFIQATIQNIGADKYSNMPIMYIRNKEEQQEIVAYLDDKCSEIDTLITKKEQLIEELETYKKSLIYEYVTGKKEVC